MLTACSSESTVQDTVAEDISESTDPMCFTITNESLSMPATRASQTLASGFMVSCYKNYGSAVHQQVVMPRYEIRYHTSGTAWDGTVRSYWTYDDVAGQYIRFWDYSAFPYRFNAIAPYPADNVSGFVLTDRALTIPKPYYAQTCINGLVTPADREAEPFLIAQLQRETDGTDHDLLSNTSEINNGTQTKSRDVWMPFHHLNSKIRFGVYHTTAWLTANKTYIENLTVSVISNHFATDATGYHAEGTGGWYVSSDNSGFTGVGTIDPSYQSPHQVFRFDGGASVSGNDLTNCQTRRTAYFLQCPGGMMQIPQTQVRMMVSFDLMREDGTLYQRFTDVPVRLEIEDHPDEYQYTFDWKSGIIYTYYLVIGSVDDGLEITFTATLTPWEDVTGSLSTDLEK